MFTVYNGGNKPKPDEFEQTKAELLYMSTLIRDNHIYITGPEHLLEIYILLKGVCEDNIEKLINYTPSKKPKLTIIPPK